MLLLDLWWVLRLGSLALMVSEKEHGIISHLSLLVPDPSLPSCAGSENCNSCVDVD